MEYLEVKLLAGAQFRYQVPQDQRGLVYVVEGEIVLGEQPLNQAEAAFVPEPTELVVEAKQPSRFMLCFGQPHGEPIHQHGPFVD